MSRIRVRGRRNKRERGREREGIMEGEKVIGIHVFSGSGKGACSGGREERNFAGPYWRRERPDEPA